MKMWAGCGEITKDGVVSTLRLRGGLSSAPSLGKGAVT